MYLNLNLHPSHMLLSYFSSHMHVQKINKIYSQCLSCSFSSFKQTKSNLFWFPIKSQKNYDQGKHIMCTLGHPQIKIGNSTTFIIQQRQDICFLNFLHQFKQNNIKTMLKNGIAHEDIIATLNILTTHSLQITKTSDFSLLKVQDSPQTSFVPHHPF